MLETKNYKGLQTKSLLKTISELSVAFNDCYCWTTCKFEVSRGDACLESLHLFDQIGNSNMK